MAVVIEITFPLGYVHATPWGTHLNEGAVEWPPSPWRLLRALVATWRTRCPQLTDSEVLPVLDLLSDAPAVRVAERTESSIRCYLPGEGHRRGGASPDTDLAVDAFAAVAPGTGAAYRWVADLGPSERRVLDELVPALPYLGRAESVCEAVVGYADDGGEGAWLEPLLDESGVGRRALVARRPLDIDSLCVRIRELRRTRRLHPPGARWIRYQIPGALPSQRRRPARVQPATRQRGVRLALSGPALASTRQGVVVAEAMRAAAMSQYGALFGGAASPVLAGKDRDGKPLRGNRHAHWLPVDLDGDRLIDTVLVWARDGLGPQELAGLAAIRRLRFHGGDGLGAAAALDVAIEVAACESEIESLCMPTVIGPSSRWQSVTPFLPQRHRKGNTVDDWLADCVERELGARGLAVPFRLARKQATSWGSFRRYRRKERLHQARPGFGMTLTFAEPVPGPLSIGLLSHFGMGRFEHAPSES